MTSVNADVFIEEEEMLTRRERSSATDKPNKLCMLSRLNKPNKQTDLKGQKPNLCCFTLFTCGGPCHLSSSKLFWDLHIVNIRIMGLNLFSKTMQCSKEKRLQLLESFLFSRSYASSFPSRPVFVLS